MSISEHEKNYTPSCWSKRYESVQLLEHYFKFAAEVTRNARRNLKCDLKIPYDTTNRSYYDVYGTDLPKDAPVFVFIHGGYWQEGSPDISAFAAPVFIAKGIKVIVVGYDLCPDVRLGDIVSKIKKAVEQILSSASTNGSRAVWIAGHSAGAHLAASLLYDKSWLDKMAEKRFLDLIKGVVLICGIYNLKPLLDTSFNDALQLSRDEIEAYSFNAIDTKNHKSIQSLKVIVTMGECDSPIFINESRECAQKLITIVDNVQYLLLRENIDHFNIVEKFTDTKFILTKILLNDICE
ncbi:kynurenine formamidase [Calliopsis andreniformis]|uniref:kynurenine formamidase n=1 Tax=Calliopsis andreniformis TaxID=337506 RepID=UPI003FCD1F4A